MQNFKTVDEKAQEWNISSRYIQYLCRNQKIEGAIKRAGSWFIPGDLPSPGKNSKASAARFQFVGTKKKIFDCAIRLFMLRGYDSVSLKDIASEIGIRQSTIYHHFDSKQGILDTIYGFYRHNYLKGRPSLAEMEEAMREESLEGLIFKMHYDFSEDCMQEMNDITKIILQRIGIDERAREIGKELMTDEGIRYVEEVLRRAIETGRLAPFDVHLMSLFINSTRIFTLFQWVLDPCYDWITSWLQDERALYDYCLRFLTDLRPPASN